MADIEIPGFEIYELIGRGGMASVYRALHLNLDREVAIKVMDTSAKVDDTSSERFIREARISARLIHPHILQIYDVNSYDSLNYISMELLGGGDLGDTIRGAMKQRTIYDVMGQMTEALDYSSSKGYVHRDIKPSNILLRDHNDYVLADFGIAKAAKSDTQMTQTGLMVGTPSYMSPEQARGAEIDGRSDLYGLAVLCFEMLTKELPYDSDSAISTAVKHLTEAVPTLSENLAAYQPFFDKAMAKEADDRFQSGREMFAAFCEVRNQFSDDDVLTPAKKVVAKAKSGAEIAPTSIAWDDPTRVVTPSRPSRPYKLLDTSQREPLVSGIRTGQRPVQATSPSENTALLPILAVVVVGALSVGGYFYWQSQQDASRQGLQPASVEAVDERSEAGVESVAESASQTAAESNAESDSGSSDQVLSNADLARVAVDLTEGQDEAGAETPDSSGEPSPPPNEPPEDSGSRATQDVASVETADDKSSQSRRSAPGAETVGVNPARSQAVNPEQLAQSIAAAQSLYIDGQYDEAALAYSDALALDPGSSEASEGLEKALAALVTQAEFYVGKGNFGPARANLAAAVKLAPDFAAATDLLGELDGLEEARKQEVVQQNENAKQLASDAVLAVTEGNLESALGTYEQLAVDFPALDVTLQLKAQLLTAYAKATREQITNEEYDAAEEYLNQGKLLAPGYSAWSELEEEISLSRYSQRRRLGAY